MLVLLMYHTPCSKYGSNRAASYSLMRCATTALLPTLPLQHEQDKHHKRALVNRVCIGNTDFISLGLPHSETMAVCVQLSQDAQ